MSERLKNRLIHDVNSSISSLQQAIEVMTNNGEVNQELFKTVMPLTREKVHQLARQWEEIKTFLIHSNQL